MVDSLVMGKVETVCFGMLHPFRTAGRHQNRFHLVEFGLIPDVKFVYQHSRAGAAVIGDWVKTVSHITPPLLSDS